MRTFVCLLCWVFWELMAPIAAYANGPSGNEGWHMGDGWHMMDRWGGDIIVWILLLVVIGVVIYLLVNRSSKQQLFSKSEETPLDILKKRYANGEITKEEYEQMKRDLM